MHGEEGRLRKKTTKITKAFSAAKGQPVKQARLMRMGKAAFDRLETLVKIRKLLGGM